jgi:hypothetical protein
MTRCYAVLDGNWDCIEHWPIRNQTSQHRGLGQKRTPSGSPRDSIRLCPNCMTTLRYT